jgi:hypothetical protein
MNRTLRTAKFKRKIAIEALREDRTIAEIAKEYDLHPVSLSLWLTFSLLRASFMQLPTCTSKSLYGS